MLLGGRPSWPRKSVADTACQVLLVGCTPDIQEVYINTTIYVNNTVYENVSVVEYVDNILECPSTKCVQEFDSQYVSNLIRDVNSCQWERDLLNDSDLPDKYHDLNISLHRCEQALQEIEEVINK